MRLLTALALVLATTSFAYAKDGKNEAFVLQSGTSDNAFTFQKGGHNKSAIITTSNNSNAAVIQLADPRGHGSNRSFVGQFHGNNDNAFVFQNGNRGAENSQATIQTGNGDWAWTIQTGRNVTNTSTTLQFGANEKSVVIQTK